MSVDAIVGEKIVESRFGSAHVDGSKFASVTLITESGRELVFSQCFGELQLSEVERPKQAPAAQQKPKPKRRRRAAEPVDTTAELAHTSSPLPKQRPVTGIGPSTYVPVDLTRDLHSKHLTLGEIAQVLAELPAGTRTRSSITSPHSFRGFYSDVGLETSSTPSTVGDQLELIRLVTRQTFTGYKGGAFPMSEDTSVWWATQGYEDGEPVTRSSLLARLL